MKNSHRHSAKTRSARESLLKSLRPQLRQSLELFSDREDDAAERAELLRGFEVAREESVGAALYS